MWTAISSILLFFLLELAEVRLSLIIIIIYAFPQQSDKSFMSSMQTLHDHHDDWQVFNLLALLPYHHVDVIVVPLVNLLIIQKSNKHDEFIISNRMYITSYCYVSFRMPCPIPGPIHLILVTCRPCIHGWQW